MRCSTSKREYNACLSHLQYTLMTQYTRDNSPGGTTQKHKIEQPQTLIPTGPSQHRSGHPPKGGHQLMGGMGGQLARNPPAVKTLNAGPHPSKTLLPRKPM